MEQMQHHGAADASDQSTQKRPYAAPDLDSAPGELMQTIRGTGGSCDVQTTGMEDGCSTN